MPTLVPLQRVTHGLDWGTCPEHGYEVLCDCGWFLSGYDPREVLSAAGRHITAETN